MDIATWERTHTRITHEGEIREQWEYSQDTLSYLVGINRFYSEWGFSTQITILKKLEGKYVEPSMTEKNRIFKYTNALNSFDEALPFEVFPTKSRIVDRINAYHTWVVEKREIPFYVKPKSSLQFSWWKRVQINGKELAYTTQKCSSAQSGRISIYFVKAADKSELKWYDKQNFKDAVIGTDIVAIEPIVYEDLDYSILICAPENVSKLPFGLK